MNRALAAVALVFLAVAAAACAGTRGDGAPTATAAGGPPRPDQVRLVVSRDFGATVLKDIAFPASEDLDVMRLLAQSATVETGYGGRFVNGIDGLRSTFGRASADEAADWFYWVDGVMADVGAADYVVHGGQTVWWDYHRWADAMMLPVAAHAFPRPWTGRSVPVVASGDVAGLDDWAATNGITLAARTPPGELPPDGGIVVLTASEAVALPWLSEALGDLSGGTPLVGLDPDGLHLSGPSGDAGPPATAVVVPLPNRKAADRPLLLILVSDPADTARLLPRLTPQSLNARIGVAEVDGRFVALPWSGT